MCGKSITLILVVYYTVTLNVLSAQSVDGEDDGNTITTQKCTLNVPLEINSNYENVKVSAKIDQLERKMNNDMNQIHAQMDHILAAILNNSAVGSSTSNGKEYDPSPLLHSCEEVKATWLNSRSDYYILADSTGHARHVYCNMEELCGDSQGGWMRVAYLNMSDPDEQCPSGFRLYEENGIRACGRQASGCQSVKYPTYSISYTQVCGRVIGYQKGSPDAIEPQNNGINQAYVDGVSLTAGNPRKHIWTFMAALQENFFYRNGQHECPCAPNSPVTPASFIGNDYFCESGSPGHWDHTTLHTSDPLWDGKQCGLIEKPCCKAPGIPWFNKVLQQPTTDYMELRVCGNHAPLNNEDSPVSFYEIIR